MIMQRVRARAPRVQTHNARSRMWELITHALTTIRTRTLYVRMHIIVTAQPQRCIRRSCTPNTHAGHYDGRTRVPFGRHHIWLIYSPAKACARASNERQVCRPKTRRPGQTMTHARSLAVDGQRATYWAEFMLSALRVTNDLGYRVCVCY